MGRNVRQTWTLWRRVAFDRIAAFDPTGRARRAAVRLVALVGLLAGSILISSPAAALAGVGMSVTPLFPPQVAVGQNNVAVGLFIANASFGVGPVTLSSITLFPACKDTTAGSCALPDPGVFSLSATGSGATAGDACTGKTFTISGPVAGQYTFTPDTPVVLQPTGSGATSTCTISFTVNVLAPPSADADPTAAGVQTRQFATTAGSAQTTEAPVSTLSGTGTGTSITTIQGSPVIVTQVSAATVGVNAPFTDTATISGLFQPTGTGTITFNLYGPNDTTCTGTVIFTSTVTVGSGNGNYTSAPFTPTSPGTYRFIASFSGDTNNTTATTSCNDSNEVVVVNKATPTIVTQASATTALGNSISDTATISGLVLPTNSATITFTLFGPNNATCTGTPIFTSTVTVNNGNGNYTSASFTPTVPGTYRWIAAYSGDANNTAVTTPCNDTNESVVVNKASPAIVTQVSSATVVVGSPFADTATISGLVNPTVNGTITFNLYGPTDTTCTGTVVFTSTVTVNNGNGNYSSTPFTPTSTGTYRFIASYSGDANNNAVSGTCNGANEVVVVNSASPAILTQVSAATSPVGSPVTDTATISGLISPTGQGTITFTVYGPNNATCTGTPIFTSTVTVTSGNGNYTSAAFTPTQAGTYRFIAAFSGDANNNAVSGACNAANELVVVNQVTPTITTQISASVPVGGTLTDTATLSGGVNPTGTITFTFFGPNNATCSGTPIFTSTVPVSTGNGSYTSAGFTVNTAGTYRSIAAYSGDLNNVAVTTACGDAGETVVIAKASPAIATVASTHTLVAGGQVSDTATISGLVNSTGTGTITFRVYAPADVTCTGTPVFTSVKTVDHGNGNYVSDPFTTTTTGAFRFVATYSGDANNNPAFNACGDALEVVVVASATPTITTQMSPPIALGGQLTDTATLTGGVNPTGSITFTFFGPNNATCTGTPVFISQVNVTTGNGSYTSAPFTPAAAGTYRSIAAYSGDGNNIAVTTACGDAGETVVVGSASPTIVTQVSSGTTTVGGTMSDTATLSGGVSPTGTITFRVYPPNDTTCSGTPAFTSQVTVNGNGNYTSGSFTPTLTGTYRFVASYSGDSNNAAAANTCGDASEVVVVGTASPAITTQVSASTVVVGASFTDTATLTGGVSPTGSITFRLYAPGDTTCTGTPVFTSSVPVNHGNGNYTSGSFTPAATGTYRWVASYSGDSNNAAAAGTCNDANEVVVVNSASPAIVTQVSSATVGVGVAFSDTATLSGVVSPTANGTILFQLYGPGDTTCTGTPVFTKTVAVDHGNGNYSSGPFTPSQTGTYRWVASYSGDANNAAATGTCNDAGEVVVVNSSSPTLVTQISASIALGGQVTDTATLAGAISPTGTITFRIFGPDNATCAGAPAFTSSVPVNHGNGNYSSAAFTPTAAGTYRAVASYSGDVNNNPIATSCSDPSESVVVGTPTPTLITQISGPIGVGGHVTDTATLSGATSPTGTITFRFYGPNNDTCTGAPAATSTVTVNHGNGAYTSVPFTPTAPGRYHAVASYSGDNVNPPVTTACSDAHETVIVSPNTPNLTTQISGSVGLGGPISDVATLSGATNPTGTITFRFYGPADSTCSGTPVFTSVVNVTHGNGNYTSESFTPTAPGTYTSIARYSGDANNAGVSTACADTNETTGVLPPPSITVTKSPSPTSMPVPGGTFTFTVVVTNTSTEALTLSSLIDDVYGDLNGKGTCAIGATLAANGGTYTCSFPGSFTSQVVASQTDTVTAKGVDTRGQTVTAIAKATVTLTAVPQGTSSTLARTGRDVEGALGVGIVLVMFGSMMVAAGELKRRRTG